MIKLMTNVMETSLSRDALDRAAKALGIVEQGAFTFESEEEMAALFDFALHGVRIRGKTAVEQYWETARAVSSIGEELLPLTRRPRPLCSGSSRRGRRRAR